MSASSQKVTPLHEEPRVEFSPWMSDADAGMWHIEADPQLRSTIVSVWVLDRMPDVGRFEETLASSLAHIPRLRQRVVEDPLNVAPPRWEDDPHFDPGFHLRRFHLGGTGEVPDLLAAAEPIAMQAFDKDRPLWEFYLVDGLSGGRAGVIMKIHHAVSDGVGMVRMTESLVERTREPVKRRKPAPQAQGGAAPAGALERLREAFAERTRIDRDRNRRIARAALSGLRSFVAHPAESLREARDLAGSLGRLLKPVSEPMSPLMRERSTSVRMRCFSIPLGELKRAGKALHGTVNDAFVSGVAAGLRRYHASLGAPVDELRMTMPINMRDGDKGKKAGNQFAPARFPVPVGIEDPLERTRVIQARVVEQRDEPAMPLFDDVNSVLSVLPYAASRTLAASMLKAVDFATSNVPGPRFPVYVSGAKIQHMFPFGPPAGAAVNVTLFSYDGVCNVGVNADPAAVSDPDLLVECLKKGVDEVLAVR